MKCPKCGYENEAEAPFCNMCYEVLIKKAASVPAPEAAAAQRPVPGTPAPSYAAAGAGDTAEAGSEVQKKIDQGFWSAIICGSFTFLIILLGGMTPELSKLVDKWAIIDVIFIFCLAFGIRAKSRAAATLMFIYFIGSKLYMWSVTGKPSGIFLTALFAYYFFRAMTATYEHHSSVRN